MHWDRSSVMYPGAIGCFGSLNIIQPHPGNLAGVDQTPTCVPVAAHGSALFIQSNQLVFSAALLAYLMAPLLCRSYDTRAAQDLAERLSCKSSAAPLYGLVEGPPSSPPAVLHQFLVLSPLPVICFLNVFFPGHCQLRQ